LLHRLARFLTTGEGDVKRLTDVDPPEFRLRLGDYRLRFYDHGDWHGKAVGTGKRPVSLDQARLIHKPILLCAILL
jgi:hypothetical protein